MNQQMVLFLFPLSSFLASITHNSFLFHRLFSLINDSSNHSLTPQPPTISLPPLITIPSPYTAPPPDGLRLWRWQCACISLHGVFRSYQKSYHCATEGTMNILAATVNNLSLYSHNQHYVASTPSSFSSHSLNTICQLLSLPFLPFRCFVVMVW